MNRLICIFPEDETTTFLSEIYNLVKEQENTVCYHFNTNDEIHTKRVKDELKELDADSCFIFLGHGASHSIYGSPRGNDRTVFFTKKEIEGLGCQLCFIACRSAELLNEKNNSIGFGDIPTDFIYDVLAMREFDSNYLIDIDESDIESFKLIFIDAIKSAFELWFFYKDFSILKLNSFFRLFINKKICNLLLMKEINNYRNIANILYNLKQELYYKP